MFCNSFLNKKMNSMHERALCIATKDNVSSFEGLLEMDNLVIVHRMSGMILPLLPCSLPVLGKARGKRQQQIRSWSPKRGLAR